MSEDLATFYNADGLSALALTFDTDWAPPFVVDALCAALRERGLRATLFCTDPQPGLDALADADDLEVALHPNFHPRSSHGDTPDAVMRTLLGWFPNATGVRSHGLVQSSPLLRALPDHGMHYDCSLHLYDHPYLQVFTTFWGLRRVPYVWSDASHLLEARPLAIPALHLETPGLKVLDLHPMLLHLNCEALDRYEAAKGRGSLPDLAAPDVEDLRFEGRGVARLFDDLCDLVARRGLRTYTMRELVAAFDAVPRPPDRCVAFEFGARP